MLTMTQGADLGGREASACASTRDAQAAVDDACESRLRIAVVTTFYPPCNFGGDGIYIRNLVHSLARRGCEVEVIYDADAWRVGMGALRPPPPPSSVAQPAGVTVHQLQSGW